MAIFGVDGGGGCSVRFALAGAVEVVVLKREYVNKALLLPEVRLEYDVHQTM